MTITRVLQDQEQYPSKWAIFENCWSEAAFAFVTGTVDFFTTRRERETHTISQSINQQLGFSQPQARLFSASIAHIAYFIGAPFHDAGTAMGEGTAVAYVAKSSDFLHLSVPKGNLALQEGMATATLGAIGGASLALGGVASFRAPIPTIKVPTFTISNGDAMVIAAVQVPVHGVQAVMVAGAVAVGMPSGIGSSVMMSKASETPPPKLPSSKGVATCRPATPEELRTARLKRESKKMKVILSEPSLETSMEIGDSKPPVKVTSSQPNGVHVPEEVAGGKIKKLPTPEIREPIMAFYNPNVEILYTYVVRFGKRGRFGSDMVAFMDHAGITYLRQMRGGRCPLIGAVNALQHRLGGKLSRVELLEAYRVISEKAEHFLGDAPRERGGYRIDELRAFYGQFQSSNPWRPNHGGTGFHDAVLQEFDQGKAVLIIEDGGTRVLVEKGADQNVGLLNFWKPKLTREVPVRDINISNAFILDTEALEAMVRP